MPPLSDNFDQLWQRLRYGRGLSHTGDDPVYYLVFHPSEMLEVKRRLRQWAAVLKKQDWTMETFSMAEAIKDILEANEFRDLWLASEEDKRFDAEAVQQVDKQLESALVDEGTLKQRLADKLQSLSGRTNTVLFVSDLEALHPYLRVGVLEQQLQGRFTVPTVFLYPGIRDGKTTLKFLGIYPADGNYRSVHIGG
jgi:BREX protein BrxB